MNAETEVNTGDGLGQRRPCLAVNHDQADCSHLPEPERCASCRPRRTRSLVDCVDWDAISRNGKGAK